ncbi:MAG: gamma-glutamylcyclotransferase [Opitutaceae bacterium]|nr:gamma-glutamylcyclotransferase [Opitutaceae bacterium]
MPLVFVYGTLKRGGSNHAHLLGQHFLGPARTQPGYTLYQPADYPGMVPETADRNGVTGELWQVDDQCLRALDRLEGLAEALYARVSVRLAAPHDQLTVDSYLYLRPLVGCPHVGSNWPVSGQD